LLYFAPTKAPHEDWAETLRSGAVNRMFASSAETRMEIPDDTMKQARKLETGRAIRWGLGIGGNLQL
jgi:hypothetical protein